MGGGGGLVGFGGVSVANCMTPSLPVLPESHNAPSKRIFWGMLGDASPPHPLPKYVMPAIFHFFYLRISLYPSPLFFAFAIFCRASPQIPPALPPHPIKNERSLMVLFIP